MITRKLLVFLSLVMVSAYSAANPSPMPHILTSIKPLALIADDLAGDWADVEALVGPNQEPHHMALSISQRKKLAMADVVIWIGPGLESFLAKTLASVDREDVVTLVDSVAGSDVHRYPHDFHFWLHPVLVESFYRVIGEKLAERFPDKREAILGQVEQRVSNLNAESENFARVLAQLGSGRVIVDHQAYSYFADYFGVEIAGALVDESGVAAGPRTMARLAAQEGISCVIVEQLPAPKRARKLADMLDVDVVAIDPLGTDVDSREGFTGLFGAVADGFKRCLQ